MIAVHTPTERRELVHQSTFVVGFEPEYAEGSIDIDGEVLQIQVRLRSQSHVDGSVTWTSEGPLVRFTLTNLRSNRVIATGPLAIGETGGRPFYVQFSVDFTGQENVVGLYVWLGSSAGQQ